MNRNEHVGIPPVGGIDYLKGSLSFTEVWCSVTFDERFDRDEKRLQPSSILDYHAEHHRQIPCQTSGHGSQVSRLAVQAAVLLVMLPVGLHPGKFFLTTIRAGEYPSRRGNSCKKISSNFLPQRCIPFKIAGLVFLLALASPLRRSYLQAVRPFE